MSYASIIKEIGRGAEGSRDMTQEDAKYLYGAMLDGGVPDLEMGAILIALRMKAESSTTNKRILRGRFMRRWQGCRHGSARRWRQSGVPAPLRW